VSEQFCAGEGRSVRVLLGSKGNFGIQFTLGEQITEFALTPWAYHALKEILNTPVDAWRKRISEEEQMEKITGFTPLGIEHAETHHPRETIEQLIAEKRRLTELNARLCEALNEIEVVTREYFRDFNHLHPTVDGAMKQARAALAQARGLDADCQPWSRSQYEQPE
jgi:hypothetical protein